jgi:citrate synthase
MSKTQHKEKGWWDTSIIRVRPNELLIKGYAIEDLMGRVSYGEMAYLMIMGDLPPQPMIKCLIEALLVAVCDHGANSPAIATAIMGATCGIPLSCVMASGMNLLGEIHGGPIEAATRLFYETDNIIEDTGRSPEDVIHEICLRYRENKQYIPGFGHPVHDRDPRVIRLFELILKAQEQGVVSGRFMKWARLYEQILPKTFSKEKIPMNVDGGGAVVLCECGIPAETAMGFVCLSRGLGLMAHGFETKLKNERIKAPMPQDMIHRHMTYSGPAPRKLEKRKTEEN